MASVVNSNNISGLIQRTLNHVDPRLVDHGKRVAYLVSRMLDIDGTFTEKEKQDICFLALLHDVGAYKTEEINEMAKFETQDIWEHSIYGYLFLYHFSPLKDWAQAILYHHVSAISLKGVEEKIATVSQIINIADRVDMFWLYQPDEGALDSYLMRNRGRRFREEIVELFLETQRHDPILENLNKEYAPKSILPQVNLSSQECEDYLKMMIYAIDFRSQHTVTHTITTTSISTNTARIIGMSDDQVQRIYYGALLHDLGKIGIPVEILEFPGKLSPQAMKIMRSHVSITEDILGGTIAPDITKIAVRHHEKLDGSGYPRGLTEKELSMEEQVVAIADIVSALLGTRSYKEAYSKDKTLSILQEQAETGKINREIVSILEEHFDEILAEVATNCSPILHTYYGLQQEYEGLLEKHRGVY
ncbi:HD domain-containing phosphohydrolase [Emergencia timonensis]|uniref:HD-GYP domain-containing protein n=1 Tax=Emergencia timonensis TaxID=1776384 RepID=UPI003994A9C7